MLQRRYKWLERVGWYGYTPTEEDIKSIAKSAAPFDWFKLKHDIADANVDTSLSEVSSLINQEFSATKTVTVVDNSMNDIDNENLENEILQSVESHIKL